jgi:hypothetical protein
MQMLCVAGRDTIDGRQRVENVEHSATNELKTSSAKSTDIKYQHLDLCQPVRHVCQDPADVTHAMVRKAGSRIGSARSRP